MRKYEDSKQQCGDVIQPSGNKIFLQTVYDHGGGSIQKSCRGNFSESEEMDGADYRTSMLEYKKQQEQEAAQKRKENEERSAKEMLERTRNTGPEPIHVDGLKCQISIK